MYLNSNMTPRLSGHFSIFGLVFFVLKSLLGVARQQSRKKIAILTLKPRSDARILIYQTWAIDCLLRNALLKDVQPVFTKKKRKNERKHRCQTIYSDTLKGEYSNGLKNIYSSFFHHFVWYSIEKTRTNLMLITLRALRVKPFLN